MSRIKQLAGQTIVYGGGNILSKIIHYLLITTLLSYLLKGQNIEFGTFSWFYNYAAIFIVLFSFRLDTALFRYGTNVDHRQSAFNTSFTIILLASIFLIFIGTFFYNTLAAWTVAPERPIYVRWFCYILAFDIISLIPFAKLRLDNRAKAFALFKILNVLISSTLIIFFIFVLPKLADNIQSYFPSASHIIDYVFISNLIASLCILILLLFFIGEVSLKIDYKLLNKMLFYVFPLVIVSVANSLIQFFAVPIQSMFLGLSDFENLEQGGTYEASRRIASLFAMFITAFNYAAEPFFFRNASSSDRHLYYGKICHIYSLIGGLLIISMVLSLDLIQYLLGDSFREGIFVIPILLMAYLFLGLYYNISIWYKLSDKTKYGAIISICGVVIFFIANILFLPIYGYVATAWATLASYSIMVTLAYLIGQKVFPIAYPIKKLCINIFIIAVVVLGSAYVKSIVSTMLYYIIAAITVSLYVLYIYTVEKGEWNKIFKIKKT